MRLHYGWIVEFSCLMITLIYGIFFSFGVFFTPILTEFGWSNAEIAATMSLHAITYSLSAWLMGYITDIYSPRFAVWLGGLLIGSGLILSSQVSALWQFYFFYGVIASMGVGALFVPTFSTVMKWFPERKGFALGVVSTGISFGILIIPPISQELIVLYGWRGAFVTLGVLTYLIIFLAGLLVKKPRKSRVCGIFKGAINHSSRNFCLTTDVIRMLRTKSSFFLLLTDIFFFASIYTFMLYIVPFIISIGVSGFVAASTLSFVGSSSIAGRVAMGFISDKIGRLFGLTVCFLILTVTLAIVISVSDVIILYTLAIIFGFAYGGCVSQMTATIGDFFEFKPVGMIYGIFEGISFGIGGGIAPLIGGYIKDLTGHYHLIFLLGAVMSFLSALFLSLAFQMRRSNL